MIIKFSRIINKRFLMFGIVLMFTLASLLVVAKSNMSDDVLLKINYNSSNNFVKKYFVNDRAYITLEDFNKIFSSVSITNNNDYVELNQYGKGSLKMMINSDVVYVNDKKIETGLYVYTEKASIYLPIRFPLETLGYMVKWNNDKSIDVLDPVVKEYIKRVSK